MANQNYQDSGSSNDDTNGPDLSDPNEGGEGEISFSTADYPELEGLQNGAAVKVTCQATVKDSGNGNVTMQIDPGSCEFETEGAADKAMKEMSRQDSQQSSAPSSTGEDF